MESGLFTTNYVTLMFADQLSTFPNIDSQCKRDCWSVHILMTCFSGEGFCAFAEINS